MIPRVAHIVFDLPLEGPFDYAVPPELQAGIAVGKRVSVPFGHTSAVGYVAGLADSSTIKNLKPIRAVLDVSPVVNGPLWLLAKHIAAVYGCSLGQAIGLMVPRLLRAGRRAEQAWPCVEKSPRDVPLPQLLVGDDDAVLFERIRRTIREGQAVLVLVPDLFAMDRLRPLLQTAFAGVPVLFHQPRTPKEELDHWVKIRRGEFKIVVGTRSAVFAPLPEVGLIAVLDEGDPSYREEQTPFYETRDVALARARFQGAGALLMSQTPSVEVWHDLGGRIEALTAGPAAGGAGGGVATQVVDLSNYKYIEKGMISIPLRGALEEALKAKAKSVLVLNRKGLYAVTRCVECGFILHCPRCSSAMTFSRRDKQFVCPHCPSTMPVDTACPQCRKPGWRSFGMGVEKLQSELNGMFPQARVVTFVRGDADLPSGDIVIATQAVLRFKGRLRPQVAALVDLDEELNRLDMRSSHRAWALASRVRAMAAKTFIIQTRNSSHHVVRALAADDPKLFYDEEMRLRKELGFAPFARCAAVGVRGKQEKSALNFARDVYNILSLPTGQAGAAGRGMSVLEPEPGVPAKMRGQYRFRVLAQGPRAGDMIAAVKEGLAKIKRPSRLIVTIEVDP